MAENRGSRERGSRSPASEEARTQEMSGARGAEAEQTPGTGKQPAQASNRRGARHEQEPEARKGFPEGQAPAEQGDGDPSPSTIRDRQQGIEAGSGSHGAHTERSEEAAQRGAPKGEHTRHGREDVPARGDRPRKDTDG